MTAPHLRHHATDRGWATRARRRGAVLVAVASFVLAGCGTDAAIDGLAGIEPAPTEVTTDAPMTQQMAEEAAGRALAGASQARVATGDAADALRRASLTGPALAIAAAASRAPAGTPGDAVDRPGEPEVVALSKGVSYPRYMVVTTQEEQVQRIHLLTAPDARTPFRVASSATVRAGSVEFSDLQAGAAVSTDGAGLAVKPADVLTQYAAALAYPTPAKATLVTVADPFAAQVAANAAAQAKTLGKLATVTETHVVDPKQTVAITIGGGDTLVFGLMSRTDKVTKTKDAQSLTYGGKALKTGATLISYETVVLAIPTEGAASLVAADEQLISSSIT